LWVRWTFYAAWLNDYVLALFDWPQSGANYLAFSNFRFEDAASVATVTSTRVCEGLLGSGNWLSWRCRLYRSAPKVTCQDGSSGNNG
jgi:hypothetical protein